MAGTAFNAANWSGYDSVSFTPASSVTDFTLLIDVSDLSATLKSTVQSDGADLRVTENDGTTELATDLIDWVYNAGDPTGILAVKLSGASGTSAITIRIYAGYTPGTAVSYDANETYGSDNAYKSTIETYFPGHSVTDRTSNSNDGTANGSLSMGGVTGKIGDATQFDGTSQYLNFSTTGMSTAAGAVFVWARNDDTSVVAADYIFAHYNSGNRIYLYTSNRDRIFAGR
jgi:hypothetical protein